MYLVLQQQFMEMLKSVSYTHLGTEVLKMGVTSLEQERFPLDGYCEGQMINEVYYLTFNKELTVEQLHNYIFEDVRIW